MTTLIKPTISSLVGNTYIDEDICRLTAYKMKVDEKLIRKMLEENEHNKHTTLYYLLAKKKDRGDLELEKELEEYAEKEMKKEQDKLKVKDKKDKKPAPLLDLTRPEMFDVRPEDPRAADRDQHKRPASRSISSSVDHRQLNDLAQSFSNKQKFAVKSSLSREESQDRSRKGEYGHVRKRSTSKSKGRRVSSREPQLKM